MNLYLHGIGGDRTNIKVDDSLRAPPSVNYDIVLTNPPFGRTSTLTFVNEEGRTERQSLTVERPDFWATTSNRQLSFLQHVRTLLKMNGSAAIVLPDNVLFEGGAGETIRRHLLHECDAHTLLRLPTGVFYAQGVKANVLFFDRKPASETAWTRDLWIYDLRTNQHFTLKTNPLTRAHTGRFRVLLPRRGPGAAYGNRAVPPLHPRRIDPAGQGQPGHLLAPRREPGGLRKPATARRNRRGDHGGPAGRAGTTGGNCGGIWGWTRRQLTRQQQLTDDFSIMYDLHKLGWHSFQQLCPHNRR